MIERYGGTCSGLSTETKTCNTQNCPSKFLFVWLMTQYLIFTSYLVNCQWGGWSQYSTCSKSCGGGTQAKSRSKKVKEKYGGKCSNLYKETRACNTQNCPGNFLLQNYMYYPYLLGVPTSKYWRTDKLLPYLKMIFVTHCK